MTRYKAVLFLLVLTIAAGCGDEPMPERQAHRTVLVYMAADNSLSRFGYENIDNMLTGIAGGNLNGGNLLVYFDPLNEAPQLIQLRENPDGQQESSP